MLVFPFYPSSLQLQADNRESNQSWLTLHVGIHKDVLESIPFHG